jgi:dTDP-glucose 4,6-dehydratase
MPRVVITGGAGFLGSHLSRRLLSDGCEVVVLDNLLTGRIENIEELFGEGLRLIPVDVTDYIHVPGPVDAVLHFASPASPIDYLRFPIQTLKVGSIGTNRALGLAKDKGARFVLASTSEVYGDPQVHPQPESYWGHVNPIGPRGVYDEAKRYAEALTMAYARTHGVNVGIARIFNTYGPRMRLEDGRALAAFAAQALSGRPVTVHGDGLQTRSLCYVDDLVDGIVRLAWSGLPGPVNLGNPQELSILDLARMVIEAAGSYSEVVFTPRPEDDPQVRRPDITLARRELGWEPKVGLADGIERTLPWFTEQLVATGQLTLTGPGAPRTVSYSN